MFEALFDEASEAYRVGNLEALSWFPDGCFPPQPCRSSALRRRRGRRHRRRGGPFSFAVRTSSMDTTSHGKPGLVNW